MRALTHLTIVLTAAAVLTACGSDPVSQTMSAVELGDDLASGPRRIEVELYPDTLLAREVKVYPDIEMEDDEYIEALVADAVWNQDGGFLVLQSPPLVIDFESSARFRSDEDSHLSASDFSAQLSQAMADTGAYVRSKRPVPAALQAPDDPAFSANVLRLEDRVEPPELEINVGDAHFEPEPTSTEDGWLHVFGLMIELRTSDGTTQIGEDSPEPEIDDSP